MSKYELEPCDAHNKEELYRMVKILMSDVKEESACRRLWQFLGILQFCGIVIVIFLLNYC